MEALGGVSQCFCPSFLRLSPPAAAATAFHVKSATVSSPRRIRSSSSNLSQSSSISRSCVPPSFKCSATTAAAPSLVADEEKFTEAAKNGNFIPLYRCIFSDHLTPVLAYWCLVREDDREAPSFLFELVEQGFRGSNVEIPSLKRGTLIHFVVCCNGFDSNVFVCNVLVAMYLRCGAFEEARQVFDEMCERWMMWFLGIRLWLLICSQVIYLKPALLFPPPLPSFLSTVETPPYSGTCIPSTIATTFLSLFIKLLHLERKPTKTKQM